MSAKPASSGAEGPAEAPPGWTPPELLAYEPELVPPLALRRTEGIPVIEEWFRWAEEWSVVLRMLGGLGSRSSVLEIGCGLGRIAFPLRYVLGPEGRYEGFEIAREKVEFLQGAFTPRHPRFRFTWADVHNTYYNREGSRPGSEYAFPYPDGSFDLVYAASVFTHLLPEVAARYLEETARVLRPGGRAVLSFFLLDFYDPSAPRPGPFARPAFAFDHSWGDHGDSFRVGVPENPEEMTAFRLAWIERRAGEAGLRFARDPIPGLWSGTAATWVSAQDLVVLEKP
jgi:SAM-dependent methyltransferase